MSRLLSEHSPSQCHQHPPFERLLQLFTFGCSADRSTEKWQVKNRMMCDHEAMYTGPHASSPWVHSSEGLFDIAAQDQACCMKPLVPTMDTALFRLAFLMHVLLVPSGWLYNGFVHDMQPRCQHLHVLRAVTARAASCPTCPRSRSTRSKQMISSISSLLLSWYYL